VTPWSSRASIWMGVDAERLVSEPGDEMAADGLLESLPDEQAEMMLAKNTSNNRVWGWRELLLNVFISNLSV
jgi:hypothetical protein